MKSAPLPPDESARLDALNRYQILDTAPEASFDDLVHLAAQICEAPTAMISLVAEDRQWFKSRLGVDACQTALAGLKERDVTAAARQAGAAW